MDPETIASIVSPIASAAVTVTGLFVDNRILRARIKKLAATAERQRKQIEEMEAEKQAEVERELAETKAKHDEDILRIRREHGDAISAAAIDRELLRDDQTALALRLAETQLKLAEEEIRTEHYAREVIKLSGAKPHPPPSISGEAIEKILSQSGIFSVTPDPDAKTGGNVFLVEDHPDLRRLVRGSLSKFGYTVFTAATVMEARAMIDDHGRLFNVVLLDLMLMDGGNGHVGGDAVAEYLREKNVRAPIIITTAMDQPEANKYIKELRAVGCIRKPYLMPQIIAAVTEHIRAWN